MVPFGVDFKNPNFAKVAEAMGAKGIRIEEPGDVREGLAVALAHRGGPVVVESAALNPAPHRRVIHGKTAFGHHFPKVTVAERIAQMPSHPEDYDLVFKVLPTERSRPVLLASPYQTRHKRFATDQMCCQRNGPSALK
jgi:hypothetical protein